MAENDLIFDLGAHRGMDTEFYLKKGFRVVAVEANPKLAAQLATKFATAVAARKLHIVDKAFWNKAGESISFHVNEEKDDWSSVFPQWANKGKHEVTQIAVETTTIGALFDQYGVPHYIKCDIEGADEMFCVELQRDGRRPDFVSVEGGSIPDGLAYLRACGYDRMHIVNQAHNHATKCPTPPREGVYVDQTFNEFMSGLFGRDLQPDRWTTFAVGMERYFQFRSLRAVDDMLARGWLDIHFTTQASLG